MKSTVFNVIVLVGVFVALAGMVLFLIETDRDPALFLATLPLVIAAVGNLLKLNKVDHQTNGANLALRQTNSAQAVEISQLRSALDPNTAALIPTTIPATIATLNTVPAVGE